MLATAVRTRPAPAEVTFVSANTGRTITWRTPGRAPTALVERLGNYLRAIRLLAAWSQASRMAYDYARQHLVISYQCTMLMWEDREWAAADGPTRHARSYLAPADRRPHQEYTWVRTWH